MKDPAKQSYQRARRRALIRLKKEAELFEMCPCCENGRRPGGRKMTPAIIGPFTMHMAGNIVRRIEKSECFCNCHINTSNAYTSQVSLSKM